MVVPVKSLLLTLALLTTVICTAAEQPRDVSIIQLVARPQDYDGQFVRLIGFVNLEFEGTIICLHEEDCRRGIMNNCLWVDPSDEILRKRSVYHQKYVLIEGIFNAKDHGHMGMYPGAIQNISRWYIWDQRSHPGRLLFFVLGGLMLAIAAASYLLGLNKGRRKAQKTQ